MLLHPFYVSVTEIRHNAAQQELQVSSRIFYDDLERTLKTEYKTPVDILHPADRKAVDGGRGWPDSRLPGQTFTDRN